MKNKLLPALLALALLVFGGFTYRRAEAPKWEFYVVTFTVSPDDKTDARTINGYGREGWELVAVEREGGRRVYFFKRPL